MRKALISVAVAALGGLAAPLSAATFVTSASTQADESNILRYSALRSFDSTLGILTGITLQVDARTTTGYVYSLPNPDGSIQTGTAELAYDDVFNAVVNGVSYGVPISGRETVSYTGALGPLFTEHDFVASGSTTFAIDPSMFDTFTNASDLCGFLVHSTGICVTGVDQGDPIAANIVASASNLVIGPYQYFTVEAGTYTLTYTYTPAGDPGSPAVPEPATWAMMLIGFGILGGAIRLQRKASSVNQMGA